MPRRKRARSQGHLSSCPLEAPPAKRIRGSVDPTPPNTVANRVAPVLPKQGKGCRKGGRKPFENLHIHEAENKHHQKAIDFAKMAADEDPSITKRLTFHCDGSYRALLDAGGLGVICGSLSNKQISLRKCKLVPCPSAQYAEVLAVAEAVIVASSMIKEADAHDIVVRIFTDSDTCLRAFAIAKEAAAHKPGCKKSRGAFQHCVKPLMEGVKTLLENELAACVLEMRFLPRCSTP